MATETSSALLRARIAAGKAARVGMSASPAAPIARTRAAFPAIQIATVHQSGPPYRDRPAEGRISARTARVRTQTVRRSNGSLRGFA